MGDGLKYVFEIDGSTPGMAELIDKLKVTEKLTPKVKGHTEAAGKGHKKHAEDARGLTGALQRLVHSGMEPFLHRAKQIAEFEFIRKAVDAVLEAPGEMIEKLKELGMEMVAVSAKAERTNKSFELLFGVEGGTEVLEYLESIAGATEFTDDRLKGAAQSLATVGFKGEGLQRALAASLDIAAFNPNKEEGMSGALFALEQAKRTGEVSGRTLKPLGIGEDQFFKALSERTGEGLATLKKKMKDGKVDAEDALETLYSMIAKKTGKDLGGAGVDMGKTLEARLTHLKDLPEQFFQKFANTEVFTKFSDEVQVFLDKFSPESLQGEQIFAALEKGATAVVDALGEIDVGKLAETFATAMSAMADSIQPVISALKGVGAVIDFITPKVNPNDVGDSLDFKLSHKEDDLVQAKLRDQLRKTREDAKNGIVNMGPHEDPRVRLDRLHKEARAELAATEANQLVAGKYLGDGLYEGARKGVPKAEGAGTVIADAATGATKKALKIESPSKVFADFGMQTAAGFAVGVNRGSDMIDDVLQGAFAVPAPEGGRVSAVAGPPAVISVGDIHVHVQGGSSSSATDIAEAAREMIHDELLAAIEQLASEMGVR